MKVTGIARRETHGMCTCEKSPRDLADTVGRSCNGVARSCLAGSGRASDETSGARNCEKSPRLDEGKGQLNKSLTVNSIQGMKLERQLAGQSSSSSSSMETGQLDAPATELQGAASQDQTILATKSCVDFGLFATTDVLEGALALHTGTAHLLFDDRSS